MVTKYRTCAQLAIKLLIFLAASGVDAWSFQVKKIRGRVVDGITQEPLARVAVRGNEDKTVTGDDGKFAIETSASELLISTVGYRPARVDVASDAEFEVLLFPQALQRQDSVTVESGAFGNEQPLAVSLQGNELKNLASVLADDPLRAVQTLPGATSNNDFTSQIAVRGASYERVGLYMDGVLMHSPFHEVEGEATTGSLTIFNGDLLEGINFYSSAIPPKFGDRTAGALDVQSREGNRQNISARFTASASNAGALVEGPLGRSHRGSWIAAVRQSYLQYLLSRVSSDSSLAFGFTDGQARLYYDITGGDRVSLAVTSGHSGLNRDSYIPRAGINTLIFSDYNFTLASAAWRATRAPGWLITNRVSFLRERFENRNRDSSTLGGGGYGETAWNGDASWGSRGSGLVEFGGDWRRLRDDGYAYTFVFNPFAIRPRDRYRGVGVRAGAYVQMSRTFGAGRLTLSAGTRVDHYDVNRSVTASPYASAAVQLTHSTRLQMAWGEAAQQAEIARSFSTFGSNLLLPERSIHFLMNVEQRVTERTRISAEAWQRLDRDLLSRPDTEPRLDMNTGMVLNPIFNAPWRNSQRAWSRGVQLMLRRRSANRFNGWVAYAFAESNARDGFLNAHFPMDYDQRHALQIFSSYRLRPTVELSGRYVFGSGLPVQGWFGGALGNVYLARQRNQFRLPDYSRADVRVNRSWQKDKARWTLFLEVVNVLNRSNYRVDSFNGYNGATGRAYQNFSTMFPILPSAGVLLEF